MVNASVRGKASQTVVWERGYQGNHRHEWEHEHGKAQAGEDKR